MPGTATFQCSICFQTITYEVDNPSNQSGHASWCGGPKPSALFESLTDLFECAGIWAATCIEEQLIGDLSNWKPVGILSTMELPNDQS